MTNADTDIDERVELADLHQGAGRLQEAEAGYRAVLADDPENADAYSGLGLLAMRIGQHDVAGQLFGMAVELVPGETTFLCNLGTALYGEGRLAEAADTFQKALEHDEHCGRALLNIGVIHKAWQASESAVDYLSRAVVAQRDNPEAFARLAEALIELDQHERAESMARASVNLDRQNVLGTYALALALLRLARVREALAWAQRLVELSPGRARHHHLLGECLAHAGRRSEALAEARRADALEPGNIHHMELVAQMQGATGAFEDALATVEQALAIAPDNADLISAKAALLERLGDREGAFALVKPLVEDGGNLRAVAFNTYLTLARRVGELQPAVELIRRTLNGPHVTPGNYTVYFGAGELLDEAGEYDDAFKFIAEGNRLKPRAYHKGATETYFDALQETYSRQRLDGLAGLGDAATRPIFIVGMPRSGTSLTEQIIASHPGVSAGGELYGIPNLTRELPELLGSNEPYPGCVRWLDAETAAAAAGRYHALLDEIAPENGLRVSDKMPQNFLHLGLIALLFPNARIIHCNRNPLDTCLSCYFQNFSASGLQFAYEQENLAHYYRLYRRLMAHWREVLPMPMYELHYERLVSAPEPEIRRMLEFCDLEWDDACLDHTRSGVRTLTASYDQVRQPIYTRSKQRWRHYKKHLKPLIHGLGEDLAFE